MTNDTGERINWQDIKILEHFLCLEARRKMEVFKYVYETPFLFYTQNHKEEFCRIPKCLTWVLNKRGGKGRKLCAQ